MILFPIPPLTFQPFTFLLSLARHRRFYFQQLFTIHNLLKMSLPQTILLSLFYNLSLIASLLVIYNIGG
jgi:hypothetical protein